MLNYVPLNTHMNIKNNDIGNIVLFADLEKTSVYQNIKNLSDQFKNHVFSTIYNLGNLDLRKNSHVLF